MRLRVLLGLLGVLAALPLAPSPARAHSEEATVAVRTYTPITVDGTLDEWVRRL